MTKLGISFRETMSGVYERIDDAPGEQPFAFHVEAFGNFPGVLLSGRVGIKGFVEAKGLAERAELTGEMTMRPWIARFVRYEFEFTGDDGRRYRYAGQKRIRHLRPKSSWTTLPGTIFGPDGSEWASSLTRFDPRDLLPFLASYRLTSTGRG